MYKTTVLLALLSSFTFADLPECHPDYDEWISLGAPISWTYPRQCRGDSDGLFEGQTLHLDKYYVYNKDLALLLNTWSVKEPTKGPGIGMIPNGLGADFDHRKSGSPYIGYQRVGTNDYCIFLQYYAISEPPYGVGVPECDFTCPIEDNVIDGPVLSLRVKNDMSWSDKAFINLYPGLTQEIGVVNASSDKCTCYEAYISITDGQGNGNWTGTNWVYNATYFKWTYFGTMKIPAMDTWYMKTLSPGTTGDPASGSISASVMLQYNGPGDMVVKLYNEYFEEVDSLIIQGPIKIMSPNGGEVLLAGSSHNISWTAQTAIPSVNIAYSVDGGNIWNSIVDGAANTGYYLWDPIPVANANDCLIRISDSGNPATSDTSDAAFTIFTCAIAPIAGDLNHDCYVNLEDFFIFCNSWLVCGNPFDAGCAP